MKRKYMIIIGVIVGALIIGSSIVAHFIYAQTFGGRVEGFPENQFTTYLQWKEIDQTRYAREEVRFSSGKNQLQGFIYGVSNDKGLVVISQGLGGTADSYFPMIMNFVDNGWRVLAFNNTGVGGSEGENTRGLTQSVIDLDAALRFVKGATSLKELPVMLVGHSWGGYAVCAALNNRHDVCAVVSFAGYNNGNETFTEHGVSAAGAFYYLLYPHFWVIQRLKFGQTMKLNAVDGINKVAIPVMIIQSLNDDVIPAQTTSIYAHRDEITNPHVEIVFLDGDDAAGHEFVFYSRDRRAYITQANENLQKYREENANATVTQWAEVYPFDKIKSNELNSELMERINRFFNDAK